MSQVSLQVSYSVKSLPIMTRAHLTVNHTQERGDRVGKPSATPDFLLSDTSTNVSCSECHRSSQKRSGVFYLQLVTHPQHLFLKNKSCRGIVCAIK